MKRCGPSDSSSDVRKELAGKGGGAYIYLIYSPNLPPHNAISRPNLKDLNDPDPLGPSLHGCRLQVSQYSTPLCKFLIRPLSGVQPSPKSVGETLNSPSLPSPFKLCARHWTVKPNSILKWGRFLD